VEVDRAILDSLDDKSDGDAPEEEFKSAESKTPKGERKYRKKKDEEDQR